MCDNFFIRYANNINQITNNNVDYIPTLVFFSENNCSGKIFPTDQQGEIAQTDYSLNNTYTINQNLSSNFFGVNMFFTERIKSLFIPFNYKQVKLISQNGRSSILLGPFYIADLSLWLWQTPLNNTTNMYEDPIRQLIVLDKINWNTAIYNQCNNRIQSIGNIPLIRYYPQSERCDKFMTSYCNDSGHKNEDICSCFKEQEELQVKSQTSGINFPVTCFGQKCVSNQTYKTLQMIQNPCNLTFCQQIINQSHEANQFLSTTNHTIFCGGSYYTEIGTPILPTQSNSDSQVQVLYQYDILTTPTDIPWYVFVMFGVSGILCLLLIYLLFSTTNNSISKIDNITPIQNI